MPGARKDLSPAFTGRTAPADVVDVELIIKQLKLIPDADYATVYADTLVADKTRSSLSEGAAARAKAQLLAFRSETLAYRSLSALKWLRDDLANETKRSDVPRPAGWRAAADARLTMLKQEFRVLDQVLAGIRARDGILPGSPNPKKEAMQALWDEVLMGDVSRGRGLELLAEVQARRKAKARAAKKLRRSGGTGPAT